MDFWLGTILGLCIGFIAGLLLMWYRLAEFDDLVEHEE